MLLWLSLLCLQLTRGQLQPDITSPGPASGIVLRDQAGLLITNCMTHTQKVFVRLDPRKVYLTHYPQATAHYSWRAALWTEKALLHAEADTKHMLTQLQKMTVTQSELSGHNRRNKRFLGALLGAAAAVGTLFNLGVTSINSVSLSTLRQHVKEIQTEIPQLREHLTQQGETLQTIGKSLKGTLVVLNTHSVLLNQTVNSMKQLFSVIQNDVAHIQLVASLMSDMLREVSSSIDSLAMGRIPPYLVPLSLVQTVLSSITTHPPDSLQAHLAYSLGGSILLHVDPEQRELAFLLNLPIVESNNIYRLKDIVNVGKPFLRDNTEGICGLQPMQKDMVCPAEAKPRIQVTETRAEIVGNQWLVNTPIRTATLTYDQHDTATRVSLPNQSMWIQVPKGAILHLGDLALYHLPSKEYQSEIEIPAFFRNQNLTLEPELELSIEEGGSQTIDITPLDTALQALSRLPVLNNFPVARSWTAADTALCLATAVGYTLTLGLAFVLFNRGNGVQRSMNRCTAAIPRTFKRKHRKRGTQAETMLNLTKVTTQAEDPQAEDN
ncbi:hypothetical protein ROHU_009981 [Labeo rohita]|uniref:Pumilio-like protein n=1 Tax=Labeo rohita TaxID=84645 RepID=A0A498LZE3_LABRO|nr:hypothetical protein ROHU_009981 [Labeo rohita]